MAGTPSNFRPPVIVSGTAREYFADEANAAERDKLVAAAFSFRRFLNYWKFVNQETGQVQILGEQLWEAQEEFVRQTQIHDWIFFLKARKLGETTIECAYDGWAGRFRNGGLNARVHLFSRRDKAAQELLESVKFGLERLPEHWRLPVARSNTSELELFAGEEDRRLWVAYPADNETAVEATCTHGHVDEWARMGNPKKVWQAIEPSMAGTCHILTTGLGPQNPTSTYWRKSLAGDTRHAPVFIGALARRDRDEEWLKRQRASMGDDVAAAQEYPMRWEDALSGGGDLVFKGVEVDAAGIDFLGIRPAAKGHKYVTGCDIGRHKDAAVLVTLDVTTDLHDVVAYERLREYPYPQTQARINQRYIDYPGIVAIEKNSAGEAVLENLDIPERMLRGFSTSKPSKARIIAAVKLALQNQTLKWDPDACSQLDAEVRGYQLPDDNVVQDSVMALAIAEEYSSEAHGSTGTVVGIIQA